MTSHKDPYTLHHKVETAMTFSHYERELHIQLTRKHLFDQTQKIFLWESMSQQAEKPTTILKDPKCPHGKGERRTL